jgi:glycosyltransferase involved in cell wall biosynthesis
MKIIGISLVKDEDIYIRKAIENVIEFCDELIILDNNSTDGTWDILTELAKKYDKIDLRRWDDSANSGKVLRKYVGKPNWIFAVDGDEIYDPEGLRIFKGEILDGKYDEYFRVVGHSFHCDKNEDPFFRGYFARSICKFFNFTNLKKWNQGERLHGGKPILKGGVRPLGYGFQENVKWEDSVFRCLHMCFLKRSSLQKGDGHRPAPKGHNKNYKLKKYCNDNPQTLKVDFYNLEG